MKHIYILIICLTLIVALYMLNKSNEKFTSNINNPTTLIHYINTSNIPLYQQVGGASKCYSCEADAYYRNCGSSRAAINTRPIKFYENIF